MILGAMYLEDTLHTSKNSERGRGEWSLGIE